MSRRHERLTTGVILNRVKRKRKRVETAAVNSMSMQFSDGDLQSNKRDEQDENLWSCPESGTLSNDENAFSRS